MFDGVDGIGVSYLAQYQTRWMQLARGANFRARKARLWGRGAVSFGTLTDFTQGQVDDLIDAVKSVREEVRYLISTHKAKAKKPKP